MKRGKLLLVPVGIGATNASAMLPTDTLKQINALDYFIAERAKTARAYLKSIGFVKAMASVQIAELNKHESEDYNALLDPCTNGFNCGLLSEAGVPGVADPGGGVIAAAHARGIEVVPLIGPSSILLALMAAGMNGQRFSFHGYLPKESGELIKELKRLEAESMQHNVTQIFIEPPFRNEKLKDKMLQSLNKNTRICLATNLTAPDQSIVSKTVVEMKKIKISIDRKPTVFLMYAGKTVK